MNATLALETLHQVALSCSDLARRAQGVAFDGKPHAIHRDDEGTFGEARATEWMAFIRNPDGNVLALASRVPPARKS